MGAQFSGPLVHDPNRATAEVSQARIVEMLEFVNGRFSTYENEAANFFALEDKRFELELRYCALIESNLEVLLNRFPKFQVSEELQTKLKKMLELRQMSLEKRDLAHWQRLITAGSLGGLAIGTTIGVTVVLATPAVLGAAGFTTAGVAAGSTAAGVQSAVYGAYTTGIFSVMQSVGAAGGLSAGTSTALTLSSGVVGLGVGTGVATSRKNPQEEHVQEGIALSQLFSWEQHDPLGLIAAT